MVFFSQSVLTSFLLVMPVLAGCTKSDNFSGDAKNGGTVKPRPTSGKPTPSPTPLPPPSEDCRQAKLIEVKVLTDFIDQGKQDPTLPIELTFVPCPNQKTNLSLPIRFDLDADLFFLSDNQRSIPYDLKINGSVVSSGILGSFTGRDLFGNVGSQFAYFESSSPLTASPTLQKATLILKLSSMQILGPANSGGPANNNFTVPSHVKVGDTPAVTGSITFSSVAG